MINDSTWNSRNRALPLLIALLVFACIGSVSVFWIFFRTNAKAPIAASVTADIPFDTNSRAWRTEEHWIVDQIARDVAEMLVFSSGQSPAKLGVEVKAKGPQIYTVCLSGANLGPGVEIPLTINTHPWDPQCYAGLSRYLGSKLNVNPDPFQEGPRDFFPRLLHPRPSEVDSLQAELSSTLTRHPRSPVLHEQAAFTLSTLGLFNPQGRFRDHRFTLCRVTGHLAVARYLNNEPGPAGRLASHALLALTGQNKKLVAEIAETRRAGGLPTDWLDTIYMLATGDWRKVEDPTKVSLGEALASYKGRNLHLGSLPAYHWIEQADLDSCRGTVRRIAMSFAYEASLGHELTSGLLDWDLQELRTIYRTRNAGRTLGESQIPEVLNALPTRAYNKGTGSLEVIGWGIWAQLFQNNVLESMSHGIHFMSNIWAVKEATSTFLDRIERDFGSLKQFPILQKRYSNIRNSVYQPAIAKAAILLQQHPELVSAANWACLSKPVNFGYLPKGFPRYQDWLNPLVPTGTAMDWGERTEEMTEFSTMDIADIRRVRETDPYSQWLINWATSYRNPSRPTKEEVENAYSTTKDFSPIAYLRKLAWVYPEEAPETLVIARKIADLQPLMTIHLGWLLLRRGREAEAAEAYQKAYSTLEDRVSATGSMEWYVLYLYRKGKFAEAEKIAQECAAVYSQRGLITMASLREAQGKVDEAAGWHSKAVERYGNTCWETMGFYRRHGKNRPELAEKFNQGREKWFYNTFKEFDITIEPIPPNKGIAISSYNERLKAFGIAKDAVIVAVDGLKVRNLDEFTGIRSTDFRDEMTITVFQGNRYQTLKGKVVNRQFGVGMVNFPK